LPLVSPSPSPQSPPPSAAVLLLLSRKRRRAVLPERSRPQLRARSRWLSKGLRSGPIYDATGEDLGVLDDDADPFLERKHLVDGLFFEFVCFLRKRGVFLGKGKRPSPTPKTRKKTSPIENVLPLSRAQPLSRARNPTLLRETQKRLAILTREKSREDMTSATCETGERASERSRDGSYFFFANL